MKKAFCLILVISVFLFCSCQSQLLSKTSDVGNTEHSSSSNEISTTAASESTDSLSTESTIELSDRDYGDLSDDEKEQLKYFNDGYTFLSRNSKDKWFLYKYGSLFRVIDVNSQCPELKSYDSTVEKNYVVINDSLYFCVFDNQSGYSYKDTNIYRYNFISQKVEKYIDKEQFKEFATKGVHMLKHNNNLVFICECNDWSNVVEVDTNKEKPEVEFKKQIETLIESIHNGNSNYYMDFIPIDNDTYRVIQITSQYQFSVSFSLIDYSYSDELHFKVGTDGAIGYFYRDGQNLVYVSYFEEEINKINGNKTHKTTIEERNSNGNNKVIKDKLPYFISTTDDNYCYHDSYLSKDWLVFNALYFYKNAPDSSSGQGTLGKKFIYFFNDELLCTLDDAVKVDLWNAYFNGKYDSPTKINSFKNSVFESEY